MLQPRFCILLTYSLFTASCTALLPPPRRESPRSVEYYQEGRRKSENKKGGEIGPVRVLFPGFPLKSMTNGHLQTNLRV